MKAWLPIDDDSDFPLENLPYGAFSSHAGTHLGVAIGDRILDLHAVGESGMCAETFDTAILTASTLNPLLAAGRPMWSKLRARMTDLLREGGDSSLREANADAFFVRQNDVRMRVSMHVGDYVDFYSSLEHATNLGRLFRPVGEPLLPNWRWLPVGYHGRAGTVVIDGTPVVRPHGQRKHPEELTPSFGASELLDIEVEVGFVTGSANALGEPIPIAQARDHIFGMMLVNDWSARDIQAWEYQPLGPFLGKSFATTISPWVVTLDALEPFRVAGPLQEPPPLEYLRTESNWAYDVAISASLRTQQMRERHLDAVTFSRTNAKYLYWNAAQQLAHATVNGAVARPGDLFASGTISGATSDSLGSLIELTWRGAKPLVLPDGEKRTFLEDGDEVRLHGRCTAPNARAIGFGEARGTIAAARQSPSSSQE